MFTPFTLASYPNLVPAGHRITFIDWSQDNLINWPDNRMASLPVTKRGKYWSLEYVRRLYKGSSHIGIGVARRK